MKPVSLAMFALLVALLALPAAAQRGESPIDSSLPEGVAVDEIIRRFTEKEKEFRDARNNYTYRQSLKVQTLDGGTVDGEYEQVIDILFDDKGRRVEQVVYAPQPTLQRVSMTREDHEDIRNVVALVVTAQDVPLYNFTYVGKQKVDELDTYVFDIAPKDLKRPGRYFEGRVWVDQQDLQIVKTHGKPTGYLEGEKKKKSKQEEEQRFPYYTSWREQIDGRYWFPTYVRADEVLRFPMSDVHIRIVMKYTDYKRYGADVKVTYEGQELPQEKPEPPAKPEKP